MITQWIQQFVMTAFFLPSAVLAGTQTVHETQTYSIDAARGAQIQHEQATVHIPANALQSDTKLHVQTIDYPVSSSNALSNKYRSPVRFYRYTFDSSPTKEIVVRMTYEPIKGDSVQKAIFYRENDDAQWEKLRTVTNKNELYAQAVLPNKKGDIAVVQHRFAKERPIKNENFFAFPGTPYSDTAAVMDVQSGKFLYRQEAKKPRHIASLTKLATTLVFLEDHPDLERVVTYTSQSDREGAVVNVHNGDQLRLNDVLMGTLIPSANNMAETLSRNSSLSRGDFITQMNNRARELHLSRTHFVEPTGLDSHNVSTAGNLARLGKVVFGKYPDIFFRAAHTQAYTANVVNTGGPLTMYTTQKFDGRGKYTLTAFKTGYYPGTADRTVVAKIRDEKTRGEIIVVLLGNPKYGTIYEEAYQLADWAFTNWNFHNYTH